MSGEQIHKWLTLEMGFTLNHLMCEYVRDDLNLRVSQDALSHLDLDEAKRVVEERVAALGGGMP